MVEMLLQRLVQDPNARVAPCSLEEIEEILMDSPPRAQEKEEELRAEEETKKAPEDIPEPSGMNSGEVFLVLVALAISS